MVLLQADSLATIYLYFSSAAVKSTQHNTELQLFELQSYEKIVMNGMKFGNRQRIHCIRNFYAESIWF